MAIREEDVLEKVVFELAEGHRRCEIVAVSRAGRERLASDVFAPYLWHLGNEVKEQFMSGTLSIVLDPYVENRHQGRCDTSWFTKATVIRFIQYVNTPGMLEDICVMADRLRALEDLLTTNDLLHVLSYVPLLVAEDLGELAPLLHSEGPLVKSASLVAGKGSLLNPTSAELQKAVGEQKAVLVADLVQTAVRAVASGFNLNIIPDLEAFAEFFGATQLRGLCQKYVANCCRRGIFYWVIRSCYVMDAVTDPAFSGADLQPAVCTPTVRFLKGANGGQRPAKRCPISKPPVIAEAVKDCLAFNHATEVGDSVLRGADCQPPVTVSPGCDRPAILLNSSLPHSVSGALSPDSTLPERSDWLLTPRLEASTPLRSLGTAWEVKENLSSNAEQDCETSMASARMQPLNSLPSQQNCSSDGESFCSEVWQDVVRADIVPGKKLVIFGSSLTEESIREPEMCDQENMGSVKVEEAMIVGRKGLRKDAPGLEGLRSSSELYREQRKRRLQQKQQQGVKTDSIQLEEMAQVLERQRVKLFAAKQTDARSRWNTRLSMDAAQLSCEETRRSSDFAQRTDGFGQGISASSEDLTPRLVRGTQSAGKEGEMLTPEARRVQKLLSRLEFLIKSTPCSTVADATSPCIQGATPSFATEADQTVTSPESSAESLSSSPPLARALSLIKVPQSRLRVISHNPSSNPSPMSGEEGPEASVPVSVSSEGIGAQSQSAVRQVYAPMYETLSLESFCDNIGSHSFTGPSEAVPAASSADEDTASNHLRHNQSVELQGSIPVPGCPEMKNAGGQGGDSDSSCHSTMAAAPTSEDSEVPREGLDVLPQEQAAVKVSQGGMDIAQPGDVSERRAVEGDQDVEASEADFDFGLANSPHSSEGEARSCMTILPTEVQSLSSKQNPNAAVTGKREGSTGRPFPSFDDWVVDRGSLLIRDRLPGSGLLSTRASLKDGTMQAPLNSLLLDLHASACKQEVAAVEGLSAVPTAAPRPLSLEEPVSHMSEQSPLESIRESLVPAGPCSPPTSPSQEDQGVPACSDTVPPSGIAASTCALLPVAPVAQVDEPMPVPGLPGQCLPSTEGTAAMGPSPATSRSASLVAGEISMDSGGTASTDPPSPAGESKGITVSDFSQASPEPLTDGEISVESKGTAAVNRSSSVISPSAAGEISVEGEETAAVNLSLPSSLAPVATAAEICAESESTTPIDSSPPSFVPMLSSAEGEFSAKSEAQVEARPLPSQKGVGSAFLPSWGLKRNTKTGRSGQAPSSEAAAVSANGVKGPGKQNANKLSEEVRGGSSLRKFFKSLRRSSGMRSSAVGERNCVAEFPKNTKHSRRSPLLPVGRSLNCRGSTARSATVEAVTEPDSRPANQQLASLPENAGAVKGSSRQSRSAAAASGDYSLEYHKTTLRKPEKLRAPWEEALWKAWEDDSKQDPVVVTPNSREPWEQALRNAWEEELSAAKPPKSSGRSMSVTLSSGRSRSFSSSSKRSSSPWHQKSSTFTCPDSRRGDLLSEEELLRLAGPGAQVKVVKRRSKGASLIPEPPPDFKLRDEHLLQGGSKLRQPKWSFLATIWGSNRAI